jgi:hypothetical protein
VLSRARQAVPPAWRSLKSATARLGKHPLQLPQLPQGHVRIQAF